MKHDSFSSSDGHTNKSNNCGTVNKSQVSRALRVLKPWNRAVPHAVLCLISPTPNRSGSSLNMGPPKQLKRTFLGFDLSTQKVRTGTAYVVSLHLRCGGVSKSTTSGPIACEWCYWKRSNGTREPVSTWKTNYSYQLRWPGLDFRLSAKDASANRFNYYGLIIEIHVRRYWPPTLS